jgi:hypothetical protein
MLLCSDFAPLCRHGVRGDKNDMGMTTGSKLHSVDQNRKPEDTALDSHAMRIAMRFRTGQKMAVY